jgi:hypothetical protein
VVRTSIRGTALNTATLDGDTVTTGTHASTSRTHANARTHARKDTHERLSAAPLMF